jgi:hypothetical protein
MLVTLRVPSLKRICCTIKCTLEAICWRIARTGRSKPAIRHSVSARETASCGLLAWIVVIEPS